MAKPYDYLFKILLIGDSGVDKTQILRAFSDEFNVSFIGPIGIDFKIKFIELAGKKIKLQICINTLVQVECKARVKLGCHNEGYSLGFAFPYRDTAGQERFKTVTSAYYRGAMGVMLVYDITNVVSFQDTEHWLKNIKENAVEDTQIILVGNKCEMDHLRKVGEDEGRKLALSHGINFIEVSSKKRINIEKAFFTLAEDILAVHQKQPKENPLTENKTEKDSESGKDKSIFKRLFQPLFGGKTQAVTSVPEEIQQDPYALDLYERALIDGKEKDRSIRINIVGNYRQGKTSLMRRLLGQKVTDVSSTDGIDVMHYKCHRAADGKFSFKTVKEEDKFDIVERLVSVALTSKHEQNQHMPTTTNKESNPTEPKLHMVTTTLQTRHFDSSGRIEKNEDDQVQPDRERHQLEKTSSSKKDKAISSDSEATSSIENKSKNTTLSVKEKETFSKELSKRKLHTPSKEIQTLFDIWDFGGQHIFYATHTLFHSKNAIYLLVFDLSLELSSVIVDEDFPEESDKNMEYFLHFWMNSIHSFVGSKDGSKPKVILVGTHKDKVKGNAKDRRKHIANYFNAIRTGFDGTKLLNHIHSEDFAVDNSIGNDEAVLALREAIFTLGNTQSKTVEIPAKWIQLEKSLIERKHIRVIPFELVIAIDEANEVPIGDREQIKLFLRYHHSKGTLIYYDEEPLSDHVVLEPQYLIDAFKCIITTERFCTNDPEIRPLWKMLQTEGRLEEALIDKQWSKDEDKMFMEHKDILISFLTKHHIISEATRFDDTTQQSLKLGWFVVPSLLKAHLPQMEMQHFSKGRKQTSVRFVMLFDNSTIVPTIYHRLMAALVGKWPIALLGAKALISKDKCVVRLNTDHAGIAEMRFDTVELTVVSLCPSSAVYPEQADMFRRFSEAVIVHEFSKLERKHEDHTKPYISRYRCNHESHDENGSINVAEIDKENDKNMIPCPDLSPHDIDVQQAREEWFQDHTTIAVSDSELNDKVLSKISRCIGNNWQLLGLELGVEKVQIEQISEDHPHSTAMKIYYMLKTWCRQMADLANMNVLVQTMQECPNVSVNWDEIRNIADGLR